jgi:hypothetical protein
VARHFRLKPANICRTDRPTSDGVLRRRRAAQHSHHAVVVVDPIDGRLGVGLAKRHFAGSDAFCMARPGLSTALGSKVDGWTLGGVIRSKASFERSRSSFIDTRQSLSVILH